MSIRRYGLPCLLLALLGVAPFPASGSAIEMADRVIVRKSERQLLLMRGDRVLRTFGVALGLSPTGPKRREGDFRTPEGNYRLSSRTPNSDFFAPGGLIMIHGQPNRPSRPLAYYQKRDWTNGCIAVSNADMVDIWLMTPDNTPIQILP